MKMMTQLLFIHLHQCKHLMRPHCEGHPELEDLLIAMETLLHINSTCGHVIFCKEGGCVTTLTDPGCLAHCLMTLTVLAITIVS